MSYTRTLCTIGEKQLPVIIRYRSCCITFQIKINYLIYLLMSYAYWQLKTT